VSERDRYALAALRVGVLAMRTASGQLDAGAVREAGQALLGEVRELLSTRATEMHERLAATLTHYLDAEHGALPQRLHALVRRDGELDRLLQAHVGTDDSMLARSLAVHLGEGSSIFKLLSPTDAHGLRAQLASTIAGALAEQRQIILREFSLDQKDSALSRLVAEFSMDDERSAMNRLSKMMSTTAEQISKHLTLDDETSALARLKRELQGTVDRLVRDNVEFHAQVREALAKIDGRKKAEARAPRHGIEFEARLGELLAVEAERLGDVHDATGESTGIIKNCKVGDHVIELGADSAAHKARVVWEAKDKRGCSLRAALDEIDEARRNRQAQVGVFVFSAMHAPEGLATLQRHGQDILVAWDCDDPAAEIVIRVAYSLARALVVRQRRTDQSSHAAVAEIDRATRAVEKQISYLDDVRKWAETVQGHGQKIAERSARMVEELKRDVDRLDAQLAALRTDGA
jgi:G:T-mismatch repair DNA endonuclease (very short patch repair protein)